VAGEQRLIMSYADRHQLHTVVFWAGVSTGMDVSRSMQEDLLDGGSASKIEAYSSLLAYSTKNAVVDITLEQLEPSRVRE